MLLLLNPMLGFIKDFRDSQQCCQPLPCKLEPFLLFVCTLILLCNTSYHSILIPCINMKGLLWARQVASVRSLLQTHLSINFLFAKSLSHPHRLVSSSVASILTDMDGGKFWVEVDMSQYHDSIFPHVGFSLHQNFISSMISFRHTILSSNVTM